MHTKKKEVQVAQIPQRRGRINFILRTLMKNRKSRKNKKSRSCARAIGICGITGNSGGRNDPFSGNICLSSAAAAASSIQRKPKCISKSNKVTLNLHFLYYLEGTGS